MDSRNLYFWSKARCAGSCMHAINSVCSNLLDYVTVNQHWLAVRTLRNLKFHLCTNMMKISSCLHALPSVYVYVRILRRDSLPSNRVLLDLFLLEWEEFSCTRRSTYFIWIYKRVNCSKMHISVMGHRRLSLLWSLAIVAENESKDSLKQMGQSWNIS